MKTINKQPKIRFKGYTDEWQQRKLKDVLDVMDGDRGKNYPSSNDFLDNGHTLFLSASNVTKEGFQFTDNQFITENKSNSMGNGKVILNDIILTSRGSIGHTALYSNKINELYSDIRINSGMLILRSHTQNYPLFIIQFLKSPIGKRQIDFISFGSAQPQITKKDINNFPIQLPSKEEQIKIGDFFTKLDDIIALHQRQLEVLEKTKKSFLQKMFPKKDETKPEIRFSGFTDDWEQRKFEDVLVSHPSKDYLADPEENGVFTVIQQGEKPVVGLANGEPFKDYCSVVLFGDHTVSLYKPTTPFFVATDGLKILSSIELRSDYLYTTLEIYKPKPQGYKRHFTLLKKNFFKFTKNTEEQQKIGNFFKQLDDTIALHQRKLEVLKNMKTSFLQKMYI